MKNKVLERVCKTKNKTQIKRLWYSTVNGFDNTVFKPNEKLSYIIDAKKKTVRIVPFDPQIKRTVSICDTGKKKVIDIKPKCIEEIFKGYTSYKVTIYNDEIFIQGYDEKCESKSSNVIDFKEKKESISTPIIKINHNYISEFLLKASGEVPGSSSFIDSGYSYSIEDFDENTISSHAFKGTLKKEKPIVDKFVSLLSLFSGIGAVEKSLDRIGIKYDLVGFSEINESSIKSYCAIHGIDKAKNLGDITKINFKKFAKNIKSTLDLIFHGSPCTDFSISGLKQGGDEGSGTQSSLMWKSVEAIKHLKPKFVVWENVKGVLMKKNIHNFNKYLDVLKKLGYNSYHKVIDAYNYGVAQQRERVFVVSIRDDIDKGFEFPKEYDYKVNLKDIVEDEVDERFYLKKILNPRRTKRYIQYDNSGKGHNPQANRLYPLDGPICTLTGYNSGSKSQILLSENPIVGRRMTPLEVWRAMGYNKEDFQKASSVVHNGYDLYNQAGNSIVPQILEEIFKILFRDKLKVVPIR